MGFGGLGICFIVEPAMTVSFMGKELLINWCGDFIGYLKGHELAYNLNINRRRSRPSAARLMRCYIWR